MFINHNIVPVIMFHSVGLHESKWIFSHISEPVECFEAKISILKSKGYNFIFWNELYEYMAGNRKLPQKSIMLTFDDGYLDNWVYAYPILKKYGAKATIFVNPEFVDRGDRKRFNLENVWQGNCRIDEIDARGFLNWTEMREMENSGLIDIQSHSLTHTWYFKSPNIIDYHRPQKIHPYPWLFWNKRPDRKPFYLKECQENYIEYGHPIFEYEKALVVRRFFPNSNIISKAINFVKENGGKNFFQQKNWREKINKYMDDVLKKTNNKGKIETKEQYIQRVTYELQQSKKMIEEHLNKKVEFICWPGGGYNKIVLDIAKKVGYKAWTLSSKDKTNFRNLPHSNPQNIKRIGSYIKYNIRGIKEFGYANANYFIAMIEAHKGSLLHKYYAKLIKVFGIFNYLICGRN